MRFRGSVVAVAVLFASSLMLAPAQLADALADAPNCLELISRTATAEAPNGASYGGPISDDSRYVAFASEATNLPATDTNGAERDVFVRDTTTGAVDLVSRSTAGTQVAAASDIVAISADGRFVLFSSLGALVDPDLNAKRDLFLRDRLNAVTTRVSTDGDSSWSPSGVGIHADLSDDGRYVVYATAEPHALGDTNAVVDVYRLDLTNGTRVLVSVANDGSPLALGGDGLTMSGDGNLVLFHSASIGAPSVRTAAVRDITAGTTRVIGAGNGLVSRNGQRAALLAVSTLTVTDLQTNVTVTVDAAPWGLPVAAAQQLFAFSADGRYVLIAQGTGTYRFFVIDRVSQRAFETGAESSARAYVGEGGLVSSTSAMTTQAYVWRGPVSSVAALSPNSADQGTSVQVTLTGKNLVPGTAVDFGPGVSVSNFVFVSLEQAKVTLTIDSGAALGSRTIAVTATSTCDLGGRIHGHRTAAANDQHDYDIDHYDIDDHDIDHHHDAAPDDDRAHYDHRAHHDAAIGPRAVRVECYPGARAPG